jgi:hypothetical protein
MVAETVSLGVLSLPAAVATLGLVPYVSKHDKSALQPDTNTFNSSIILIIALGLLATWTGYMIGQMKLKYPYIMTMADAGEVLGGAFGREFMGICQILFLIFIMSSHLLTFTVAMNTITSHGTCSLVFGIVGTIISFLCCLPRTLEKMSWLSLVCEFQPTYLSTPRRYTDPLCSIRQHHRRSFHLHDRRRYRKPRQWSRRRCQNRSLPWFLGCL